MIPAKRRLNTLLEPVSKLRRNEDIPGIILGKGKVLILSLCLLMSHKTRVLITVPYRFIQSHRDRDMFRQPEYGKKYFLVRERMCFSV